jgi:VWFA-related protein
MTKRVLARQDGEGQAPDERSDGETSLPLYVIREEVETRLVLVPVTVTNRRRRPITDLQPHEFQLRIDREVHPIATFDPPVSRERPGDREGAGSAGEGAPPPEAASSTAAGPAPAAGPSRRHRVTVAIVIDVFQTHQGHLLSGLLAVREYLESGLPPAGVEVGLFALTHGRLTRLTAFSEDMPAHLEALARFETNYAARDNWIMEEDFRQAEVRSGLASGHIQVAEAAVHGNAREQAMRVEQVLDSLRSLSAAMSRLPGRKTVVFVSDGVREQAGLNYAIGSTHLARFSVSMREPFRATGRTFKRAGVAFSPVSLLGVYFPGPQDPNALDELIGSMEYMAKITGGRRPIAINDFTGEVARAVSQPLESYVLGFVPLPVSEPGTIHRISVRVLRPNVVVSARSEYVEQRPGLEPAELMDGAAVLPDEFRDLDFTAELRILPAPDEMAEIHVQARFPPSLLAWTQADAGRRVASVQFNGLLRRRTGQVVEIFRSAYALTFEPRQAPRSLVLQETATVSAGDMDDLVVVATDMTSGKVGTAVVPAPAASRTDEGIQLSGPVFLAPVSLTHLLTSTREPVLGVRLGGSLYLPTEPPLSSTGPVLVMARVVDLPEAGRVRFCVGEGTDRCLPARLQPDPEAVAGKEPQRSWAAWISLAEDILPEADVLRVEILDDTAPAASGENEDAGAS